MLRWCGIAIMLSVSAAPAHAANFQQVTNGLEYKKVVVQAKDDIDRPASAGFIHVFRIDPSVLRLGIVTAKELGLTSFNARTAVQRSGALLFVNGGFFTPEYASLGLLVRNGIELNRLKWTSWWHIFQVKGGVPQIISKQEFGLSPEVEMAIEAGPRALVGGAAPAGLKPSAAERTVIGIDKDGGVVIAVTEGLPLSVKELSGYLKAEACVDALNLDGGSSTQAYAKVKRFELNRGGFGMVANGIGVFAR